MLSRVMVGGQVAMKVSLVAISVSMTIGLALGMIAGFGPRWLGGLPPEPAAVFFGNAGIVIWWLYRYRLIIPQVRWANY